MRGTWFTMLRDTAHSNVSQPVRTRKKRLLPDENALTVVPGFIGAYPNAIYRVTRADLPALTRRRSATSRQRTITEKFAERFAVRRTDPAFWTTSDAMTRGLRALGAAGSGLFDYNRLENR